TLIMEIGGVTPGSQYDQIQASGAVGIDGTLSLQLINGYVPPPTQQFTMLAHASRVGMFANIAGYTISGSQAFAVHYTNTAATAIAGQWQHPALSGIIDVPGPKLDVTGSGAWSGTLIKRGAGAMEVNLGSSSVASGAMLNVQAGSLVLKTDVGATDANLSLQVNGGSATFESSQHLASLDVANGRTATLAANVNRVLVTPLLDLHATGKLDLKDNKLIVRTTPIGTWDGSAYTGVAGLVDAGRGNASNAQWDGNGIVTSDTRAANNNDLTSIGVIDASDKFPGGETATSLFAGQTVTGADTLVMFTWGGDANLDGKINIDDYGQIDFNVGSSGSVFGWYNGDFNYDGKINIDDYGIIDFNVTAQTGTFPTAGGAEGELDGVVAVPEPASLGLLALGAAGLMGRRRRRCN
ncbi:MAG: PEP-CTERM sorting domain-containing protein, partial [Tepidisphaeraceae bacterium]